MNNVGNFLVNGAIPTKIKEQKMGGKEKIEKNSNDFTKETQEKFKNELPKNESASPKKAEKKENELLKKDVASNENVHSLKTKTTEATKENVSSILKENIQNSLAKNKENAEKDGTVVLVKIPTSLLEKLEKKDGKGNEFLTNLLKKSSSTNEKETSLTLTQEELSQLMNLLFVHLQQTSTSPVKEGEVSTKSIQLDVQFNFSQKETSPTNKIEEADFVKKIQTLRDIAKQLNELNQKENQGSFDEKLQATSEKKSPISLLISFETTNGAKKQDNASSMNVSFAATLVKETADVKQKNQEQTTSDNTDKQTVMNTVVDGMPILEDKNTSFSLTKDTAVSNLKELKEVISNGVDDFLEVKTMGDNKATIRLQQEGLGKLEIQIEKQEGKIMVYVKVDDASTQEKVEMVMDNLKSEMKEKEINLEYEVEQENKDSEKENQQQQEKRKEEQDELKKKHNREMIGNNHDQNFMEFMGGY